MRLHVDKVLNNIGLDRNQAGGFLDLIVGLFFVVMPWFYIAEGDIKSLAVLMVLGSMLILYAIFTDYRHGLLKSVARHIHEALDLMFGVTMMALMPVKNPLAGFLLSFAGFILLLGSFLL